MSGAPPPAPPSEAPEEVARALALDAAGRARLEAYVALLVKWQARINLIGPATVPDLWRRHILDCGQLAAFLPDPPARVCDLGSGAGLPGLVLAALAPPGLDFDLVESDARKAAFLGEAARVTGAAARVVNARAETLAPGTYDVVTARAVAPLPRLLGLSASLLKTSGKLLILKGKDADAELTDSAKQWKMTVTRTPSITDQAGVVLEIRDLEYHHG